MVSFLGLAKYWICPAVGDTGSLWLGSPWVPVRKIMGWELSHYVCPQPPSLPLTSTLLPGSSCTHNPSSGWDPFSPPGEGLGHHHTPRSPSCPRRQVPLAHALSPEEARPFEQTCEGPPISPPFKNKHSLWLPLALTLGR